MPASFIPLKRCTAAAVPGEGDKELPAATMPSAKRRRDYVVPSRFTESVPLPAAKRAALEVEPQQAEGDGEVYDVEVRVDDSKGASFGAVKTTVWTPDPPQPTEVELYRACRNISRSVSAVSGSVVTSVSNAGADIGAGGSVELEVTPAVVECKPKREAGDKKEDFYWPEDFVLGDVVWARSGKKCPAWPAVVIDPMQHAPEVVLNSCIPGALCVMFFGYSAGGHSRLPSVLIDFRDSLCIRSGQADSVQQLRKLSLPNVAFSISNWMWGAHCKTLSTISLSLMTFKKGLLRITTRSASLKLRLIVNLHGVVIAVVIAYHQSFQRKRSKQMSSCFVGTVKSYCSQNSTVAYAGRFGTTQMVEIG
ncbi:hypothetical protein PR202_ga24189 [Eleusine coracana subsp. coracana]|uniref:PWWP domain-containing protein n=1 Tax=Eleusine coracana subsp. coracana TaxID=191504 RepID=A0AAV5D8T9_ELECO|nr:hypothetical protein PR202_ga24189 [Eleusine coracana subsp. coracana]